MADLQAWLVQRGQGRSRPRHSMASRERFQRPSHPRHSKGLASMDRASRDSEVQDEGTPSGVFAA